MKAKAKNCHVSIDRTENGYILNWLQINYSNCYLAPDHYTNKKLVFLSKSELIRWLEDNEIED